MSIVRESKAEWKGDLKSGSGKLMFGSKAYEGPYSFKSRTEDGTAETNPEELIAAAHAGCYSMQLSALLTQAGHAPEVIRTSSKVHLDPDGKGFVISQIELFTEVKVSGMNEEDIKEHIEHAKSCPVSKALGSVKIDYKSSILK